MCIKRRYLKLFSLSDNAYLIASNSNGLYLTILFCLSILFLSIMIVYIFDIITSVYTFFDILFIQFVWFIQSFRFDWISLSECFIGTFLYLIFYILDSRYPNIFKFFIWTFNLLILKSSQLEFLWFEHLSFKSFVLTL